MHVVPVGRTETISVAERFPTLAKSLNKINAKMAKVMKNDGNKMRRRNTLTRCIRPD